MMIKKDLLEVNWDFIDGHNDVREMTRIFTKLLSNIVPTHTIEVRLSRTQYNL